MSIDDVVNERVWEQVFAGNLWTPETKGDEIVGCYCKRRDNVGVRNYTFYTLDVDGEQKDVLGTTLLNQLMDQVPVGWEVRIVYQGTKPSDPPHKPLKLFDVFRRPAGEDHVSGNSGDDQDTVSQGQGNGLNSRDTREVQEFIGGVVDDLRDTGREVTGDSVWKLALEQAAGDHVFMGLVKDELRRMKKTGEL